MTGAGTGPSHHARAFLRALGPAAVAALLWWWGRPTAAAVAAVAGTAVLVLGLVAPRSAEALDRLLGRIADGVAHGLATALAALGWLLVVVPTWGLSRLVRYEPLDDGRPSARSAWSDVDPGHRRLPDGTAAGPDRLGGEEHAPAPRARRRARLRWLPALVAVGAVTASALGPGALDRLRSDEVAAGGARPMDLRRLGDQLARDLPDDELEFNGLPVDGYAHEDEPWIADHMRELLTADHEPDLVLGARNGDVRGRYLNVEDGRRVTWTPRDPELVVWWFGGSTMYGIGQRDDHTIPSVVARRAAADGTRIRGLNFGVSGDVNWQGTLRFAEALQSELPRPDLVVFYDGVNDRGLASHRVEDGNVDPDVSDRLPLSEEEREERRRAFGATPLPFGPERDELEIELAAAQYRRGVLTARDLGAAHGIPVVHVWQPQPFAKRPSPADDELYRRLDFDPANLPGATRTYAQIRERSGVDPLDLSTVLDDVEVPVYFDSSHTNELGARLIASELYERLRPTLEELRHR